jgi:UDP-N-acetylbacillosamine N-acetyltransferase
MNRPAGKSIYVLGFGGHARSVADVALAIGVKELLFIDANARPNEEFAGFPVVRTLPPNLDSSWSLFPAMGDNLSRKAVWDDPLLPIATLVSLTATIGTLAEIGEGTLVAHHAHVGPAARVGRGVIINTGAIVEHECEVKEFSHVSVNSVVAGRCCIGSNVFIGAGATVIDGIRVCDDVVIGAGATVVDHIIASGTYVGTPARFIK